MLTYLERFRVGEIRRLIADGSLVKFAALQFYELFNGVNIVHNQEAGRLGSYKARRPGGE